jgi:DNA-binding beta-propeller fold protein YncE
VEEVELRNKHSGQFKTFYHRPPRPMLAAGQKAFIKLLLALWLCYLVAGCTPDTAPHLPVKAVRYWSVPPQGASIPAPRALTISADGEVYVLDDGGRVLVFDGEGKLKRQWDMPESDVGNPEGICLFKDGRVAVADTHYHRVMFFDRDGEVLGMLGSLGKEPGQFIYPVAIVQDNTENFYVAEYGDNDRIQKFSVDGSVLLEFGSFGTETGQFQRPSGIVWRDGKIYAVDAFNNRIQVFSDSGEFLQILGDSDQSASLHYPYDISVTADGSLYVIEYGAGRVSKFDLQGRLLGRYGTTGRGDSQFVTPWGLTVDSQSRVLVADTGNRRIVELDQ